MVRGLLIFRLAEPLALVETCDCFLYSADARLLVFVSDFIMVGFCNNKSGGQGWHAQAPRSRLRSYSTPGGGGAGNDSEKLLMPKRIVGEMGVGGGRGDLPRKLTEPMLRV